jgi:DNA primase
VALCGTALTAAQARLLKRFTSKVVLSLDPDAAGQGAAARSSELFVAEGFDVNVALLPAGEDPDTFVRRHGGRAYMERLTGSRPYLEFLLDRAAAGVDLNRRDGQKKFLDAMLGVAATIPDAATRDRFADRLAHTARITESVIREEIRKAAARRQTTAPAVVTASSGALRPAEQGLLWALVHRPVEGLTAVGQLQPEDVEGLLSASTLQLAAGLVDLPPETIPQVLRERLTPGEWALVERAARVEVPAAPAADCVTTLKRLRVDRERAAVQEEIDRLQERAAPDDGLLLALWTRKKELLRQLDELT